MTATVYPIDAQSGAPTFSGRTARQALGVDLTNAVATRQLGARSGVRKGTPTSTVTATSTVWTVKPHLGVLDVQTATEAGAYRYAIDADQTGAVTAANATYARKDIVYVTVSDHAEDGSGLAQISVGYTAGTPAASPVAPTTPTRSMILAVINVPKSGDGSPTVTWTAPYTAAAGGILVVRDTTERANAAVSATTENPIYTHRKDAQAGSRLEVTEDGTTWSTVAAFPGSATRSVTARRSGTDNFASGSFTSVQSASLPSSAPAGMYLVTYTVSISCTATAVGYLRGFFAGVNVTSDDPWTVSTSITSRTVTVPVVHTGGAATVEAFCQVASGTGTANPGCRVSATWVGPA